MTTRTRPSPGWRSAIRRARRASAPGGPPSTRRRTRPGRARPKSAPPSFPSPSRAGRDRARPEGPSRARDDLRRLAGADEVARVDRLELLVGELLGEPSRLPAAVVAQRPVGVALEAAVGVPVGLAVANEEERGHADYASQPWTSASPTASASSPAPPAGSASRRRSSCAPRARRSSRPAAAAATSGPTSRSRASRSASCAETIERHGRLDVLVNNVGSSEIRKLEDVTDDVWQASFEINLMSAVRATRAALPGMRERGRRDDRQRLLDRREAPLDRDAGLLGDEGGAPLLLAARRRPLREGRDPLQRRHARPDRDGGVAGRGRARRPAGRARGGAREGRRRPAARPARAARGDRRRDRRSSARRARATSPAPRGAPTAARCRSSSEP